MPRRDRDKQNAYMRDWRAANSDKMKAYQKELYRSRREIFSLWQNIVGCQDCGEHFWGRPECLDCDHVRGDKLFNLASNLTRNWVQVLTEVEKCDVVCSNCHRTRTVRTGVCKGRR